MSALTEAAYWALCYFKSMDEANAQIHCAPVRYSPITFRLARGLGEQYEAEGVSGFKMPLEIGQVISHEGHYEEDKGR